jgi:hypothetical protein
MILILFFLLLLISPVYSDDFNVSGDGALNEYYQTTAITVSYFPDHYEYEKGITYDLSEIYGLDTYDVLNDYSIGGLTTMWYSRRVPNVVDRVAGPPGTVIDILYLYFNDTKHDVDISKIVIPFSRNIPSMGNWNNIVTHFSNTAIFRSIDVSFDNKVIRKEGMLKKYEGLGLVANGAMGSRILDTIMISNPLEVVSTQIQELDGYLNIQILIRNNSTEKLNDIIFEHEEYVEVFTLLPADEIFLEYNLEKKEDLGYYRITNPNTKTECVIYGSNYYNWLQPNAVTVLAYREDGGWINGAHVQPVGESFCITRLPYSTTSSVLKYEKQTVGDNILETEEVIAKEEGSTNELNNVLGVDSTTGMSLPKTAKKIYY